MNRVNYSTRSVNQVDTEITPIELLDQAQMSLKIAMVRKEARNKPDLNS
jgi:hypothetical protein